MLVAAIFGEVLRGPPAGHSVHGSGEVLRLPPRHQRRGLALRRSALSALRGGSSTDDLRGGHSYGGESPPCRLRQRKLVFVGAPFCEGQNLAGTDLAPEAMRRAGLEKAVKALGWEWEDEGDLDFAAHFASKGILWEKAHLASLQRYRDWVASGMEINFSTWDSMKAQEQRTPTQRAVDEVVQLRLEIARKEALLSCDTSDETAALPGEPSDGEVASYDGGKPSEVVNSKLMGTGLELVYEAVGRSAQSGAFSLTIGGDHSVAAASIAAVQAAYPTLGVIWVDAHADANTPETSPSMHYHGMPAAHLMGWFRRRLEGFDWFPNSTVLEESRLAYIGLRDIDTEVGARAPRNPRPPSLPSPPSPPSQPLPSSPPPPPTLTRACTGGADAAQLQRARVHDARRRQARHRQGD